MNTTTQAILISVIVPLAVGCIPALITWLLGRRTAAVEPEKVKADAAATLTGGYEKLVQDYQERMTSLQAELGRLQQLQDQTRAEYMEMLRQDQGEIESLRGGIRDLERLTNRQADELCKLRGSMTEAEIRIANLERENKGLRKALEEAETRITELERENEKLRADNRALVCELGK